MTDKRNRSTEEYQDDLEELITEIVRAKGLAREMRKSLSNMSENPKVTEREKLIAQAVMKDLTKIIEGAY